MKKKNKFSFNYKESFLDNLHRYITVMGFIENKDYIEVDCGDYVAFCPFRFEILNGFNNIRKWKITHKKGGIPFWVEHRSLFLHCVVNNKGYFRYYYDVQFDKYHNLKVFFLKKDAPMKGWRKDYYREFTCWLRIKNNKSMAPSSYDTEHAWHLLDCKNHKCEKIKEFAEPIIEGNYDRIVSYFKSVYKWKKIR